MNSSSKKTSTAAVAAIAALLGAAALGCKSNGNQELLERELRCQEDRIYQLEDELDEMNYALEASRRENQSLKKEMSGGDKGAGGQYSPSIPPAATAPAVEAPPLELPGDEAPKFEFVPKSKRNEPLDEAPQFQSEPLDEAPPFVPQSGEPSADPSAGKGEPPLLLQQAAKKTQLAGDASKISKLVLNRQLTGGWNPDGKHGDEGIFVAFEPRDGQNKLVEAVGDVSIVVLDPAQTGAGARVGRWDYSADEAALHFGTGLLRRGLQFELPWPSPPPTSGDLRLFVRLTTPDGRKVETDARIRVTLHDGWSTKPASSEETKTTAKAPATLAPQEKPKPASRVVSKPKRARRPGWSPNR